MCMEGEGVVVAVAPSRASACGMALNSLPLGMCRATEGWGVDPGRSKCILFYLGFHVGAKLRSCII